MVKVMQYGEGNFLRTFVDAYFNTLNEEGGEYAVSIVKPITFGNLDNFKKQNNRYHIVLRGVENGCDVENVYPIDVLFAVIDPFADPDAYYALATDPELKIIVSNTTEAGICYHDTDAFDDFEGITYPAKLTKFLLKRFEAGLDGLYLLPVELIENNADELRRCVDAYIKLWNLPAAFAKWNAEEVYYCNTLVDRIVSGHPRDEETKARLTRLIGEEDCLVSVGEPFGLWAVENKGDIAKYIAEGHHNIDVVLTNDIGYYKKRKVRVLNGSHTNLVPSGLVLGMETVYDCMKNEKLCAFVQDTLREEINPFVSDDLAATTAFSESVTDRFLNPFLNHQLTSIALNSISKWKARNLPSFKDYYAANGKIPAHMTVGFSYLMALYSRIVEKDGKYVAAVTGREIEMKDDAPYLAYFAAKKPIADFMKDAAVWGEDLSAYCGFVDAVLANVDAINEGKVLV